MLVSSILSGLFSKLVYFQRPTNINNKETLIKILTIISLEYGAEPHKNILINNGININKSHFLRCSKNNASMVNAIDIAMVNKNGELPSILILLSRSEERRVGKEYRSRL